MVWLRYSCIASLALDGCKSLLDRVPDAAGAFPPRRVLDAVAFRFEDPCMFCQAFRVCAAGEKFPLDRVLDAVAASEKEARGGKTLIVS